MNIVEKLYRKVIHKFIVKYLLSCGGTFHHDKYGVNGKYVVLMNEESYHEYKNL